VDGSPPKRPREPDDALVEAAAHGSREAFDDLVRRHQAGIVNLVRALTSGRDAEDLAQDVFVRAWKSLRTFRGESSFRTWLHRVAINVVRTNQAKHGRTLRLFRQPLDEDPEPVSADQPFDTRLARRQLIDRALASLPEELRSVVTLRDIQGLDYQEIAEVLGIPIGTVESRIFRARQRLRPLLAALVK
jgi:RNA polymerase sigma-70 factor (ECF subfamily)